MQDTELYDTIDRGRGIVTDGGVEVGTPSDIGMGGAGEPIFDGNAARQHYRTNQSRVDEEAWKEMDDLMVETASDELTLFRRLRDNNLVDPVPIELTISMWSEQTGSAEAEVDMDGRSQTVEDLPGAGLDRGVPIPLIASAFRLGHRGIEATSDIRDSGIDSSTRAVTEVMEQFIVEGWDRDVTDANGDTFTLYGVTNHPDRNTLTGSADWNTDETVIEDDILRMVGALEDDEFDSGSYDLWLNPAEVRPMRQPSPDFDNQRIRDTVRDLDEVGQIVTSNVIPEGEGVMLDLRREVLDAKLSNGNVTDVAEWDSSPFETRAKVFSGFAPRVKSRPAEDGTRQSGIVHITGI